MRIFALQKFQLLQEEVKVCKGKSYDRELEIECCYEICSRHWMEVQKILVSYEFASEDEEIDFFRNVKPLFTSEIEYYSLLYHAQMFQPTFVSKELVQFWERESQRLDCFIETNAGFYRYMQGGDQSLDSNYFLRPKEEKLASTDDTVSDFDRRTSTSHDHLLSILKALEKYTCYVSLQQERIKGLDNKAD